MQAVLSELAKISKLKEKKCNQRPFSTSGFGMSLEGAPRLATGQDRHQVLPFHSDRKPCTVNKSLDCQ